MRVDLHGRTAHAQQDYPVKPITLLIPFPPGTGNDVVGRIVGNQLTEYLGQRVVADNRAGASGNIAIDLARRAAADGYTLVVAAVLVGGSLRRVSVAGFP
ncbi:MAG: Bug family tripartite tricarboxylate transporter substrate binding protein [Burkholderiales bacterium]